MFQEIEQMLWKKTRVFLICIDWWDMVMHHSTTLQILGGYLKPDIIRKVIQIPCLSSKPSKGFPYQNKILTISYKDKHKLPPNSSPNTLASFTYFKYVHGQAQSFLCKTFYWKIGRYSHNQKLNFFSSLCSNFPLKKTFSANPM